MFVTMTLLPWLRRVEKAIDDHFTSAERHYSRFNVSSLLRGATSARYGAYRTGRDGCWLSINEIRRMEDLGPVEDENANRFVMPLNYRFLDEEPDEAATEGGMPEAPPG